MKLRTAVIVALFAAGVMSICPGCHSGNQEGDAKESVGLKPGDEIPMREITVGSKTYNVADVDDSAFVYVDSVDKSRCLTVISKREYRLYVYEVSEDGKDTIMAGHFPICYAKYPEAKERSGDMRTPECTLQEPFHIQQIQDASTWHHDFGDGRGSIPSYGAWFLRLETPGFSGVGIHGSTSNEASVPGRDSEGCIRLRDNDLLVYHDMFAEVGQPVIIKGIKEDKLPFEAKAQATLGDKYKVQRIGYKERNDSLTIKRIQP